MPGINSILDIGRLALFGSQAAIQTTGNNISNVNTPGYSRREVRFEELASLDYRYGQIGTGAKAAEVMRHFDELVEAQYNDRSTLRQRYEDLWENLKGVENLFNESNAEGLGSAISQFWQDWQDLALRPNDYSTREALLGRSQNLVSMLGNMDADMVDMQEQARQVIRQEVDEVNDLMSEIARVNVQINVHHREGENNANQLLDERAQLVRQLSEKMDIKVIESEQEHTIITTSGQTLVQGGRTFDIKYEGPRSYDGLTDTSTFDGSIGFEGSDAFEYHVEVIQGGQVSNSSGPGTAMFRVSLDGGRTWLRNADGSTRQFYARPEDNKVTVNDKIDIWFKDMTQPLNEGDVFTIVPKNGIYWYENTSDFMNITPMIRADGTDVEERLTGGTLAAFVNFEGPYVGLYRDKLDALTKTFVWEVNKLHSQGAGLALIGDTVGTYSVRDTSIPLGSDSSGMAYGDRLSEGNMTVYFYDAASGNLTSCAAFGELDFDPTTPGIQNFDPTMHSLEDVRDAFNDTFGGYITADILNDKLRLSVQPDYQVGFGTDTSGLLAGLGINTYFEGYSAATFSVNAEVQNNTSRINAGHINGAGESNPGDNATALAISSLSYKHVSIVGAFDVGGNQTILDYYSTIVSKVGADTSNAEFNYRYNKTLADDLYDRQEAISGVNLDEEMSDLIKYQHSYRAAAKLISTADQMLQTLLGLKQ